MSEEKYNDDWWASIFMGIFVGTVFCVILLIWPMLAIFIMLVFLARKYWDDTGD